MKQLALDLKRWASDGTSLEGNALLAIASELEGMQHDLDKLHRVRCASVTLAVGAEWLLDYTESKDGVLWEMLAEALDEWRLVSSEKETA